MAKSFLVIGLGQFGSATAIALAEQGHQVLAADINMELVSAIKDRVMNAVQCDTTDEKVIEALGVANFDAVVVAAGTDIRTSVLTTVLLSEHGAKYIVAKAQDSIHEKLLYKVGAHKVVQPEQNAGIRLARSLSTRSVVDYLQLSEDCSISELYVPPVWADKTLLEADVRKNYGVSVIAIRRKDRVLSYLPADTRFEKDDTLVIIGSNEALSRVAKL